MFVKNDKVQQDSFFDDIISQLPESRRKTALKSIEYCFHEEVFMKIDEEKFSCLYSDVASRPNSPVNHLVAALILRTLKGWTFAELFSNLDFNVLTRMALGIYDLQTEFFSPVTIFNFQNRLDLHYKKSGVNLFEEVFDQLTARQIKKYGVKTGIQRTDSFQLMSNIAKYSRLRLIIEVLRRHSRVHSKEDKDIVGELLSPYIKAASSEKYCYERNDEQLPSKLTELAEIYQKLHQILPEYLKGEHAFKVFERLYHEQFHVDDQGKIHVKEGK